MAITRRVLFPSEIGRLEYLFRFVFCMFLLGFYLMVFNAINPLWFELNDVNWLACLLSIPIFLILIYMVSFVIAPRLRDAGIPGLAALLVLVPVVNLFLSIAALFLPTGAISLRSGKSD